MCDRPFASSRGREGGARRALRHGDRDRWLTPHPFISQVALDIAHHNNLLAMHKKASPRDAVVGWFATSPAGAPPAGGDALIHEFYSRECLNPVRGGGGRAWRGRGGRGAMEQALEKHSTPTPFFPCFLL